MRLCRRAELKCRYALVGGTRRIACRLADWRTARRCLARPGQAVVDTKGSRSVKVRRPAAAQRLGYRSTGLSQPLAVTARTTLPLPSAGRPPGSPTRTTTLRAVWLCRLSLSAASVESASRLPSVPETPRSARGASCSPSTSATSSSSSRVPRSAVPLPPEANEAIVVVQQHMHCHDNIVFATVPQVPGDFLTGRG